MSKDGKPPKVKKHHLNKDSTQADLDAAWTDGINTATSQPDTLVEIRFDAGMYRIPQISSGTVTIIGDDLVTGPPGVLASIYTHTESGKVVVEYSAYIPPPS